MPTQFVIPNPRLLRVRHLLSSRALLSYDPRHSERSPRSEELCAIARFLCHESLFSFDCALGLPVCIQSMRFGAKMRLAAWKSRSSRSTTCRTGSVPLPTANRSLALGESSGVGFVLPGMSKAKSLASLILGRNAMHYPLTFMKIRPFQFGKYDPISNSFGKVRVHHHRPHQGWDLLAAPGTPVYAIADGELTSRFSSSYGKTATLKFKHGGRTYYAFYAHLSVVSMANVSVTEGTVIGKTGMTGNAKGIPPKEAHLHFEVRTTAIPPNHSGLHFRIDPGDVLGYSVYSCSI